MVLLVVGLLSTVVLGQDRADLVGRVERWSSRAADVDLPVGDRLEALEAAMREREALMSALPGDAHRPIWLLDQAADTLQMLGLSLHDTRLVVGLLDARERERALHAVEESYLLADTAGGLISERFAAQQRIIDSGGQLAQGDRALNVRLAETELAVRRPLLMGRAMALQGAGGGGGADVPRVPELLEGVRLAPGGPRAVRDISVAIALMEQATQTGLIRAEEMLEDVLSTPEVGDALRAEAVLLRAMLARGADAQVAAVLDAAEQPPFVDAQGLAKAPLALLAMEARARVLRDDGQADKAARALMELPTRRDLGGTTQQLEAVLDDRLAALAEGIERWREISPDVVLRAAQAMVAQDDAASDEHAITMLDDLLWRFAAEADEAERLSRAYAKPIQLVPSMELLARLLLVEAQREADAGQALEHRRRALALVLDLLGPEGNGPQGLLEPAATLVLGQAGAEVEAADRQRLLNAAIGQSPSHAQADRWRLGLAALRIERDQDLDAALALAEAAMQSRDASTRADATALVGAIHASRIARENPSVEALRAALAFARQHPTAARLDVRGLGLRLATQLVQRREPEAAREAIEALDGDRSKEATILRGRAYSLAGQRDSAVEELRRAARLVTPEADRSTYWLVWTELLELVNEERLRRVRQGNAQAADELSRSIRGQFVVLRGVDANLGGAPFSGRLSAIEATLPR